MVTNILFRMDSLVYPVRKSDLTSTNWLVRSPRRVPASRIVPARHVHQFCTPSARACHPCNQCRPHVRAQALPGRKWVFTNGDRRHAQTCLSLLGIEECFEVRQTRGGDHVARHIMPIAQRTGIIPGLCPGWWSYVKSWTRMCKCKFVYNWEAHSEDSIRLMSHLIVG